MPLQPIGVHAHDLYWKAVVKAHEPRGDEAMGRPVSVPECSVAPNICFREPTGRVFRNVTIQIALLVHAVEKIQKTRLYELADFLLGLDFILFVPITAFLLNFGRYEPEGFALFDVMLIAPDICHQLIRFFTLKLPELMVGSVKHKRPVCAM